MQDDADAVQDDADAVEDDGNTVEERPFRAALVLHESDGLQPPWWAVGYPEG